MNGRELHPTEVAYLQQLFGYTIPGRYWMNAQGVGGVEGDHRFLTWARSRSREMVEGVIRGVVYLAVWEVTEVARTS